MLRSTLILMAVLCWMPVLAGGQKPATPPALRPEPGATPAQGLIQLDVVATDKSGKPIAGLSQSDFTLLDNNHPASIVDFHALRRSGSSAAAAGASDSADRCREPRFSGCRLFARRDRPVFAPGRWTAGTAGVDLLVHRQDPVDAAGAVNGRERGGRTDRRHGRQPARYPPVGRRLGRVRARSAFAARCWTA